MVKSEENKNIKEQGSPSAPNQSPEEIALDKSEVDRLLETVLNSALAMMNAERGVVFLLEDGKPKPVVE
ncbi:MAG: hypothetical protein ACK4OO_08320, partial [bacterium]